MMMGDSGGIIHVIGGLADPNIVQNYIMIRVLLTLGLNFGSFFVWYDGPCKLQNSSVNTSKKIEKK